MFRSVKATNFDQFLRHQNFLAELQTIDTADDLAKHDATFDIVPGLANPNFDAGFISFRAVNDNLGWFYLRHQDFRLKLQERPPEPGFSGGEWSPELKLFNSDATFLMGQGIFDFLGLPNPDPNVVSFQAILAFSPKDIRFIRHRDWHFFIDPPDANFAKDFMFTLEHPFIAEPPPIPPPE